MPMDRDVKTLLIDELTKLLTPSPKTNIKTNTIFHVYNLPIYQQNLLRNY